MCGHTRLLAAKKLKLKQVPVHVADNLTPEQIRAYRLLDNRSHEESSWDMNLLGLELLDLKQLNVDFGWTGFDMDEIDALLSRVGIEMGLTDPDEAPAIPAEPVSRPGDLWLLGAHRLLCGDATSPQNLELLLDGEKASLTFTDPPYNVDYTQPSRNGRKIANDNLGSNFPAFLEQVCRSMLNATDGAVYICMSSSEIDTVKRAFVAAGGHWSTFVVWVKDNFTMGRSDYQRQYEPILYGWPAGTKRYWCGDRDQGDVWQIEKPRKNDLHPTMKPVALVRRALLNSSKAGGLVLDPFGGAGSTVIACEQTGRHARILEIEPGYVDVMVKRWQDFTGKAATLQSDGRPFEAVGDRRRSGACTAKVGLANSERQSDESDGGGLLPRKDEQLKTTKRKLKSEPLASPKQIGRALSGERSNKSRLSTSGPVNPQEGSTKKDRVLELLKRSEGATLSVLVEATGWQLHSVRGFLSGTVQKKLGLRLASEKNGLGERVYKLAS